LRKGDGGYTDMPGTTGVLEIDKPHFSVRLYENLLKIDLKGTVKNEIEEAVENKPLLRETIGSILGIFVPLHIHLSDIDSVHMDETGKVKIHLPRHRDIMIPLEPRDAKRLIEKLNQLIPKEKAKELERVMEERKLRKIVEEEREMERASFTSGAFPIPQPLGVLEKEKEAEEKIVEEQEKQD
jgi:hypothetical protein